MACQALKIGAGAGTGIVCSRGKRPKRCWCCMRPAVFQCDWKVSAGSCDRHICDEHAYQAGKNKHLCPEHLAAYIDWQIAHSEAKG